MPKFVPDGFKNVFWALLLSNAFSVGLLLARIIDAGTARYWFLIWNLMLGWLPFAFAWWLTRRLKTSLWLTPANLLLTLGWLTFLPNSFYLVSDLIHLHVTGEVSLLFDATMFFSFIFNGYVAGLMSVYLVHRELLRRLKWDYAHALVGLVFLLSGFAIYMGRFLRWNTWDILISPAGLLFDVSERVINPSSYPQTVLTTVLFFSLLSVIYVFVWQLVKALSGNARRK